MQKNSKNREIYLQYRRDGYTKEEALTMLYPVEPSLSTVFRWEHWVEVERMEGKPGRAGHTLEQC